MPLSGFEEARTLPRLGADEFYFSFQPPGAKTAISRRELSKANFDSLEDVALAVEIAKKRECGMLLALNKTYYTETEMPGAVKTLDNCLDIGVDGVIVADAGLLRLLHARKYNERAEIILSAVAAPTNALAIGFYETFGISRVILPRHISPDIAARYVRKYPSLRFEVFVFNWHCWNLDGVCRFQHDVPDAERHPSLVRNGCCLEYEVIPDEGGADPNIEDRFRDVYKRSETGCAVCSMFDFARGGVTDFKIVGRLLSYEAKAEAVTFVNDCRKILESCGDRDKFMRLAKRHYESYFGDKCAGACYHNVRDAI